MFARLVAVVVGFAFWGNFCCLAQSKAPPKLICFSCHDQVLKLEASAHASVGCLTCHPKHDQVPHPGGIPKPECAGCHAEIAARYAGSVHGRARVAGNEAAPTCSSCHGDVHELKATNSPGFHQAIPDTCGGCHPDVAAEFRVSVHGQAVAHGVMEAPVCTTCHGEHAIVGPGVPTSPVSPAHIRETCAQCHGNVRLSQKFGLPADRIVSFDASYHGLAARAGAQLVANCASCHGFHKILPSTDPQSSTNQRNLPATCGRCHPGAGKRFALGPVHFWPGSEPPGIYWVRVVYLVLIAVVVALMLLHNAGDWAHKVWQTRIRPRVGAPYIIPGPPAATFETHLADIRMYPAERVLHVSLMLSFGVLVWTGFALKYPDQWWAWPLAVWEHRYPVRGTVHRLAAVILMSVALAHALSLISRDLRGHWEELWPKRRDVGEAWRNFTFNLGFRSRRPPISTHSYIEKAEYWAVVWGTVVMSITGLMMWFNNFTLALLPKAAIDFATAIHFYEAVLATLSIVAWHFYSVIFDPEVYPLDTAWLTGISVKRRRTPGE